MNHSHLTVQHLLQRAEKFQLERPLRNVRPDWVAELAEEVATLFTPLSGVARVGYECQLAEDRWEVCLFLGQAEFVGGAKDGEARHANFQFDVQRLQKYFTRIDRFTWNALPELAAWAEQPLSFLLIEGAYEQEQICFKVFSVPPQDAGVGIRFHQDGRCETV